jgi:hypothetical protein
MVNTRRTRLKNRKRRTRRLRLCQRGGDPNLYAQYAHGVNGNSSYFNVGMQGSTDISDPEYDANMAPLQAINGQHPSRNILHRLMYAICQGQITKPYATVLKFISRHTKDELKTLLREKTVGKMFGFGGGHTPLDILNTHCTDQSLKNVINEALGKYVPAF